MLVITKANFNHMIFLNSLKIKLIASVKDIIIIKNLKTMEFYKIFKMIKDHINQLIYIPIEVIKIVLPISKIYNKK
jgi:hypothetical protein